MSDEVQLKVKPLFVIKTGTMNREDISRAEKGCGIVIVECKQPESARFLEPPPDAGIDTQARAALALFRKVLMLGDSNSTTTFYKADLVKWFVDMLLRGEPMTPPEKVKR